MKLFICYIIVFFQLNAVFCQKNRQINLVFNPVFGNQTIAFNDSVYLLKNGNNIKFETLKFYISSIQFYNDGKLVWQEKKSYHLYDATVLNHQSIKLSIPSTIKFSRLIFNLGIDSVTNVSGAMGNDLDPTKGMYWAWQSGYINLKLEGTSNACPNPKKEFQFHLGGYIKPLACLKKISLEVVNKNSLNIYIDIKQFTDGIDLSKENHIMSPSASAVELSELVAKCFYSK